jgi:hypothetical protein
MIRDYGLTVVVIHVAYSLISLGSCYLLVESGLPVMDWLLSNESAIEGYVSRETIVAGGNFAIAYAFHKLLMPLRIGATLISAPVLVKWLRQKGVLRPPAIKK